MRTRTGSAARATFSEAATRAAARIAPRAARGYLFMRSSRFAVTNGTSRPAVDRRRHAAALHTGRSPPGTSPPNTPDFVSDATILTDHAAEQIDAARRSLDYLRQ